MEIEITNLSKEYIDDIAEVENSSFTIPWSRKAFEDELNNAAATYFIAKCENKAVGYIGVWFISGEGDITNIAVLPPFRRHKIASKMLTHTINYCKDKNLSRLTLEVRETNEVAISLYNKLGFEPIGRRKAYYADTHEDAIIMELKLV